MLSSRVAILAHLVMLLASGSDIEPCASRGSSPLNTTASSCRTLPDREVLLRTRWDLPGEAAPRVPLHIRVQGALSFQLDGCGNHTTSIEGGLVRVQVQGFSCPTRPGPQDLALSVALPSFVPHGNYTIEIDGLPLLCATVDVAL